MLNLEVVIVGLLAREFGFGMARGNGRNWAL